MHRKRGDYEKLMARIFSGWEVRDEEVRPWTDEDEKIILEWLNEAS